MTLAKKKHLSLETFFNSRVAVGEAQQRAAFGVTATAQQISIGTTKTTIEIHNSGSEDVYFGGSDVASTTGIPIFPDEGKIFSNVKPNWNIYVRCAAGKTSTLRIVEYE